MNKDDIDRKYTVHCLNEHHGYAPGSCKECNVFRELLGLYPYDDEEEEE